MLQRFRQFWTNVVKPVAHLLIRLHVSPDVVTVIGTLGVCFGALFFYPRGHFLAGSIFITAFIFSDLIDGYMARTLGRSSAWGSFLDSTLDRFGDAAIFVGLALWFFGDGDSTMTGCVAVYAMTMGSITSYIRAKAESLGLQAKVGIAERAERLVAVLAMTGFAGIFDQPLLVQIVLWVLSAASTVTVGQRMVVVFRQTHHPTDVPAR
jgi:CDP-diacylglycerol---glycerol-3-phosphate 3-phosphatidyltransferase